MHVQGAGQIDSDKLIPLSRLGFSKGAKHVPTGIVHQDVNRSELRFRRGNGDVHGRSTRDIALEGFRLTAGPLDIRSDSLCCFEVEVENGNACALATKSARGGSANPAAASRNYDSFILEPLHNSSLSREDWRLPISGFYAKFLAIAGHVGQYIVISTTDQKPMQEGIYGKYAKNDGPIRHHQAGIG